MYFFYEHKGLAIRGEYGSRLEFGAHLHNHIEIIYMIEGTTTAFVDSKEYLIEAGDIFVVFPNQIHQYLKSGRENYIIVIFPEEICSEFKHIFAKKVPVQPLIKGGGKKKELSDVFEKIVECKKKEHKYVGTLRKGYFLVLLSELSARMEFTDIKSPDSDTIQSVLEYCSSNYSKDITLATVSKELHISKYYISHLFAQKLHMGFHEYISTLRISEACRLLTGAEMSITEIAYAVGFNSTRSFNRAFIKYTNTTPTEYRRQEVS